MIDGPLACCVRDREPLMAIDYGRLLRCYRCGVEIVRWPKPTTLHQALLASRAKQPKSPPP